MGVSEVLAPAIYSILKGLFLITAVIILIFICKFAFLYWKNKRADLGQIDKMSGSEFELYLSILLGELGYKAKLTPSGPDFGADLIIEKDGQKTAVQAKRYNSTVGIKAVQEAIGSCKHYKCEKCMVITNNYFTPAAAQLAKSNGVELWNRNTLAGKIRDLKDLSEEKKRENAEKLKKMFTDRTGRCEICGAHVSDKLRKYYENKAAKYGGKLYCEKHMKDAELVPHQAEQA